MGGGRGRAAFVLLAANAIAASAIDCASPYEGSAPETIAPERDAASDDAEASSDAIAPPADGDADAAACDITKPFASPTPLDVVNSTSEERFPRLTADELTLVFASDRGVFGAEQIYIATRTSLSAPFGTPVEAKRDGFPSTLQGTAPSLSADGLTLFFARSAPDAGTDIFVTSRVSRTTDFKAVDSVAVVNSLQDEGAPYLAPDGLELWFESNRGGNVDIFHSKRPPDGGFTTPVRADELSSLSNDTAVVLSADELTVFFGSLRDGGAGNFDVWTATRTTKTSTFAQPMLVPELSSTGLDVPGWLSPDGCRMYLYSNRSGSRDLYIATRPK